VIRPESFLLQFDAVTCTLTELWQTVASW